MALVVKDRVKETTTTTGTGTINLAGAASGFQSFVSGVGNSNTTFYTIEDANGCLLYTSPSPRDVEESRMPSSA